MEVWEKAKEEEEEEEMVVEEEKEEMVEEWDAVSCISPWQMFQKR